MPETLDALGLKYGTDKSSAGHNVLSHYERFLSDIRQFDLTLFEIGGLKGASLRLWEEYFPQARIVCLDIRPEVKALETTRISVEIGNSGNPSFLSEVVGKHGPPTVVLDDGSHRWDHQRVALKTLFPYLSSGGFYIVEDLHSSHEPRFAGTDEHPFTDYLKLLVDFMNTRGDARRAFVERYNKTTVEIARMVDFACFVPRSCVLRKK